VLEDNSQDATEEDMAIASSTSATYMRIRNQGKQDDRLIAFHSNVSEFVEIHTTETRNGVSMMAKVSGSDIPGRRTVTLESGGLHIMLIKLKKDLRPEDSLELVLEFENSGQIPFKAEVRAP
jgi:copper(I)-binding protein